MKSKVCTNIVFIFLALIICSGLQAHKSWAAVPSPTDFTTQNDDFSGFEADLESIRQILKIPGMSAAVVQDQEIVWASGFGYADLEQQIEATPDTPYGLASVTKPIAAVLIMQLVEEGLIDLDAPVRQYGVNLVAENVTVRHLLTHTSEGVPGTEHHYNGNRYGYLSGVIEGATGKTYAELISERVLLPLGMKSTALNPISSWGGTSHSPWLDFQIALGWGDAFRHYHEVYAQLASPYQLDDAYNLIPGMYQIYHNPAAGLISSVADLAKFDLALDAGLLLGDAAKTEMFAPAISTYKNRTDLNYGLGWYVQNFEGLRILWHTGRWAPSTSALYLKIPEEDLTFIVLANTDNLTVPFNSIGSGDVSKSLLVVSFFRHFIYPAMYGIDLPDIDWTTTEGLLISQLSNVEDESARRYLERELWAYRQAFASVGEADRVNVLWRVSQRAFKGSEMGRDPLFFQTTGKPQTIPPSVSPSTFAKLSWSVLIWLGLVCTSLICMSVILWRKPASIEGWRSAWLLSTLFIGPFVLLIHTLTRARVEDGSRSRWQLALSVSTLIISGYAVGWALALTLIKRLGSNPHPLAILGFTYLIPLLVTFTAYQIPSLPARSKGAARKVLPGLMLTGILSNNISFAVMFPLTMIFDNRILTTVPGSFSLFSWVMLSLISTVNLAAQFPVQYWGVPRGYWDWSTVYSGEQHFAGFLKMRWGWFPMTVSVVILVVSLAITISKFV